MVLIAVILVVLALLVVWSLLAAITHIVPWLVVGLISGALASRVVRGRGLGCLMDIVVGIAGGLLGGLVIRWLDPGMISGLWPLGLIGDIVVSFLGATVLLAVVRLLDARRWVHVGRRRARKLIPR
jgi:uncharacterized membrane protein YeaQ/YmgE (transglycosylase-associated protein family)